MTLESAYIAANETALLIEIPNCLLIRLHGPDAEQYLHARTTQEIRTLSPGEGAQALLLSPQAKIQGFCMIARGEDDFLLLAEQKEEDLDFEPFLTALLQFKVAEQFEIERLSPSFRVFSLQGPLSSEILSKLLTQDVPKSPFSHQEIRLDDTLLHLLFNCRGASQGFDIIVPEKTAELLKARLLQLGAVIGSPGTPEMLRIASGIPLMGTDISEKVSATDLALENCISFDKGCYPGQEAIEKLRSRGRPNRRFIAFSANCDYPIPVGAEIFASSETQKTAGSVSSSCYFPNSKRCLGLGFIKAKIEQKQSLRVGDLPISLRSPHDLEVF